ncbi:MAG: molybdopterin-dependent oxidoreductase [Thermomicrobiales bacterium]
MIHHSRRGIPLLWLLALLLTACGGTAATRTPIAITASAIAATAMPTVAAVGGVSATVSVGGGVETPLNLGLADVRAFPPITLNAETRTRQGSQGSHSYTGALLKDVLDKAKPRTDPNRKNDLLSVYITAVGSDGYRATVAYGEIDPDFGAQQIIVAYEMDGKPLDKDGVAELVVPGDKLAGRWVKNLVSITVGIPAR